MAVNSHRLSHPEYCVALDEVGGNINMKGDGYIGGGDEGPGDSL